MIYFDQDFLVRGGLLSRVGSTVQEGEGSNPGKLNGL